MADEVPAFDDIPSFDEMPEQAQQPAQQATAPLRFDDIPSFDEMPASGNEEEHQRPQAEGPLARGVRTAANAIVPTVGGFLGAGAAGLLTAPSGPGAIAGAVAGGLAGAAAGEKLQNVVKNALGFNDEEQEAVNAQEHPIEHTAEQLAVGLAGMRFDRAASAGARLVSAGLQAGIQGGTELATTGNIDPASVAMAAAGGAVFPAANKLGEKIMGLPGKFIPGRPNRTANPAAEQAHEDVGEQHAETNIEGSSLAQPVPHAEGVTVGTPADNSPTNSRGEVATGKADGTYAKAPPAEANGTATSGDISPDIQAALGNGDATSPSAAVAPPPVNQAAAQVNAQKPRISLKRPAPEPVVDTGMPQPGEPVAVGENEATPMPPGTPERAAAAIARSKRAEVAPEASSLAEIMKPIAAPEITGKAASPTPAQAEAGNYQKARTMDFGKPIAIETHAGEVRQGKGWQHELPYDYGYFNKTKGPDGDHIDFIRPAEGSPEFGDKHFIVDQKNETTGKYDEPKVMTYVKDEATARDLYNRGFGDNKGPERLHDITEVSRGDLVKYLTKHTNNPPKGPYGEPMPKTAKPVKERAVFKDLIEKKPELAEALKNAPDEVVAAAIEGKRTRKYGVKGGYPVEGLTNEAGEPVTAKDKKLAAARSEAHKKVNDWFEKSAPKGEETNGELLDRLKGHPYPGAGEWAPTFKPKEWMLAKAARDTLKAPTPKNIEKYREAERLLRSGDEKAVEAYRGGNRVEADIARSRRSGDEAIQSAEEQAHLPGRNEEEERMLENIGRQRGDFDVPHEEAEAMVKPRAIKSAADIKEPPAKTVDITKSSLAKPIAKMGLKELTKKPTPVKTEEPFEPVKAASEGKRIKVDSTEMQRMLADLEKANRKGQGLEALPAEKEPAPRIGKEARDLFDHFVNDQRGSVNIDKIANDFKKALRYTDLTRFVDRMPKTHRDTYLAKKSSGPTDDYVRSLSEDLHGIGKEDVNQWGRLLNKATKEWPKELDAKAREQIFNARDADSAGIPTANGKTHIENLPPDLKAMFDKHIKPILDANDAHVAAIRQLDPDRIGPDVLHHISHIMNGDTSRFNMLKSQDDPMAPGYSGLSVNASAAKARKLFALERVADGKRFVIEPTDTGFIKWENGKKERIKDPNFEFEDGGTYKAGPNDYIMRQAMAREKEANVKGNDGKNLKFYKDAGFAAMVANAQLGSMSRHLQALHNMTQTPEWKKLTTTNPNSKKVNEFGYRESNLPNFRGTYMHPDLKAVFDDFAGHIQTTYQQLNSAVTKLIFLSPTAHGGNVAGHMLVGRGWDNLSLPKNLEMLRDLPKAINSVMAQDAYQQRMNRARAGTMYGKILTTDMVDKLGKAFKLDVERNPSSWGPIADKIGIPLHDMVNSVYRNVQHVLWAGTDVMETLRVRELQRKGMSMRQAVVEAERDIPNYRMPTKIFGSREVSEKLQNSSMFSFMRYHYGMMNAYANMIKPLVERHATMGDRVDAAGKMVAMGLIGMVLYPQVDKLWKYVTGNEHAEAQRRGPFTIPHHIAGAVEGKEDVMAPVRSGLTISPLLSAGLQALGNKDWRGKNIVEPGDVRQAFEGNPKAAASALAQAGEFVARSTVAPYNMYATAAKKSDETGPVAQAKNVGRAIRDQALDIRDVSPKAAKYEEKVPVQTLKDARTRAKHGGNGPLEGLVNTLTNK